FAFEEELNSNQDYQVTTQTIEQIIPRIRPTLTDEIIEEFEKDRVTFART
ncbi:MAG: AAA family ATPase, partial [Desulfobacteraceae bacterium]